MQELGVYKMNRDKVSYKDLYELIDRHITVVNNNVKETNTKLDNLHSKVENILIQTTRTNGRVSALETWEAECNRIISELRAENKEQNKQLNITALDLTKITLKVSFILSVIGFVVYILTGFVI
jgi:chromosome segregation ATPase